MIYRIFFVSLSLIFLASCTGKTGVPTNTGSTNPSNNQASTVSSPTFGAGEHTLTIYADFQCPACNAFNKSVSPVLKEYAQRGLLQIVYKQFPLTQMHKNAERDALAALCSVEQNKYIEYKDALYALEERKAGARVTDEERANVGNGILDSAKLLECIKSDKYLTQVQNEIQEGIKLGVQGTPTVFFDGKRVDNKVFSNTDATRVVLDKLTLATTASGVQVTP